MTDWFELIAALPNFGSLQADEAQICLNHNDIGVEPDEGNNGTQLSPGSGRMS